MMTAETLDAVTVAPHQDAKRSVVMDIARRRMAWDTIVPCGTAVAGIAGVFTASFGWAVMLPVMAAVFLTASIVWRLLWVD